MHVAIPTGPPLVLGDQAVDIPLAAIPPARRAAVAAVCKSPTVRRPLTVRVVRAPIELYGSLLDDLSRTASLVREGGLGTYGIEELGPGLFRIEDGRGAHARVERVLAAPGRRVYLATGQMEVPLLPTVRGWGVITLRYEAHGEETWTGGQVYFRLRSRLLHALVHAVVPLVYGAIDQKIGRLTDAAIEVCRRAAGSTVGSAAG